MVTKIDDGGPAFARSAGIWTEDHGDGSFAQDGMSLRDYFAAKAMQGWLDNLHVGDGHSSHRLELAQASYAIADAMLAARTPKES